MTLPVKLLSVKVVVDVMAVPTRPLKVWLAGLIDGAAITVMLTVAVALPLVAPVPVTVWVVADWVAVGVPLMTPVAVSSKRPAGNAGLMLYVTAPVKLLPVNADVAVIAVPTVPLRVWVVGLMEAESSSTFILSPSAPTENVPTLVEPPVILAPVNQLIFWPFAPVIVAQ